MKRFFLMRLLFLMVLFPRCTLGMDSLAVQAPHDAFANTIQSRAQEFQLTQAQAKMIASNATQLFSKPGAQKKYILLFVIKPEEREALAPTVGPLLDSSKLFLEQFARCRMDEANPPKAAQMVAGEKTRLERLSVLPEGPKEVAKSVIVPASAISAIQEQVGLEIVVYSHGSDSQEEQLLFTQFCNILFSSSSLPAKDTNLLIIAQGQNAHFVNMCSHGFLNEVDTLIYFQSPVYDWYWSRLSSSYIQSAKGTWAPANYRHVYNLYSKAYHPVSVTERASGYRERKYRQPMAKNALNVPVKNIRLIKQMGNSFEDLTEKDFISGQSLSNLSALIQQADQYKLNFDLLGKIFDDNNGTPSVIINRFITAKGNSLLADFGTDQNQPYEFAKVTDAADVKRQFTFEVEQARGQLINMTQVNVQQGWFTILFGSLKNDLDRIKKEYDSISTVTNSLFAPLINPEAERFAFLITKNVQDQLDRINQFVPINKEFATAQIKLGALYIYYLLVENNPRKIPNETQQSYLRSLLAIIWFFYGRALEAQQAFEEGTFLIEDKDFKIFNFFFEYARRFNSFGLKGTLEDFMYNLTLEPFAYGRESSHFKTQQKMFRHYGIDVRFGQLGTELPLLPPDKRHLLWGKVFDNAEFGQVCFFKPENNGLYYADGFIHHTQEFITAQARKFGMTTRSDDDEIFRKERIPTQFLKDFQRALGQTALSKEEQAKVLIIAKDQGIKTLYTDGLLNQPAMKELEQKYAKLYNHLRLRFGREIILTTQDLSEVLGRGQDHQKARP